jgi:hypothetical protein
MKCDGARDYVRQVKERREKEVETVARLTGWDPSDVRAKMTPLPPSFGDTGGGAKSPDSEWWKQIWK